MSSNNNKNNDDGGGKKKEPSDTLDNGGSDEKKHPALSILQEGTQCDGEESSFLAEKRLIAERSHVPRQMVEKKLVPRSSEKDDPDSSRFPISANMSNSNIITPQDKQDSVDKSSYAIAATPATAGIDHAHPFADEAKEDE